MPRLGLINPWKGACPPDGYRWVDPLDGWISHAWDYGTWVEQALTHYRVNERPVPLDLGEQMQEQLCLTLPPGWCNYDLRGSERPSVALDWNDLQKGLRTFAKWIAGGAKYVEQAEADRRALICSRCYLNVNIVGCSGCQKLVREVVTRSSKYDSFLRGCAVCKCVLSAKIHFPLSILGKEAKSHQDMYPDFCWLKESGENYHG
jgi:hypothetical protein